MSHSQVRVGFPFVVCSVGTAAGLEQLLSRDSSPDSSRVLSFALPAIARVRQQRLKFYLSEVTVDKYKSCFVTGIQHFSTSAPLLSDPSFLSIPLEKQRTKNKASSLVPLVRGLGDRRWRALSPRITDWELHRL